MTAVDHAQPATYHFTTPDLSVEALAAVTARVAETAADYDRSGDPPLAGLQVAHEAGLLTATVGAAYGGPQVGPREVVTILAALGQGDPSVALLVANNLNTHAAQAAHPHWPEASYADLLRASQTGPALVNAIRAEPELGAPARGGIPKTTVRRDGSTWLVNGHKAFATGGVSLAYHVVWATVAGEDTETPRVGHVIVPADAGGISWFRTWDHLGLRASNTHDVVYDNVRVPAEAFVEIPRGDDGVYRDPAAATTVAGFGHTAIYVGVSRAARAAFVDYARTRVPTALGRPIADTERIQATAGEIDLLITQAETLLYGAIARIESGGEDAQSFLPELSNIKVAAARSVVAATQLAVGALGNAGLTRHNSLERHLRDALCVRVHPPQEDTVLVASGRRILGV